MKKYELEKTTLWKFPSRGTWATHNPKYRGNWTPHIPRNLILKYTKENDTVLDMFVGGGTTLIETKILKRKGIGVDINPDALKITKKNLNFNCQYSFHEPDLILGSATNLNMLQDNSIDLICTHPPYSNIIKYSNYLDSDLSLLNTSLFFKEIKKVAKESHRVLKKNKYCCLLIADKRESGNINPLGFKLMDVFLREGFILKDIVIKEQFNCSRTEYWKKKNLNFHLIAHEYLFIFRK